MPTHYIKISTLNIAINSGGRAMDSQTNLQNIVLDSLDSRICVFDLLGNIVYCNESFRNTYLQKFESHDKLTNKDIVSEEYLKISFVDEAIATNSAISRQVKYASGIFSVTTTPITNTDGIELIVQSIHHSYEPFSASYEEDELASAFQMTMSDNAMISIAETIHRISRFDSTVLITGESGTGKSMLAKIIHENSRRAKEPFVTINCATIPENLIESELFGYVSGAFTGANQKGKPGLVELADKGTLFLDEIGLLPYSLQSKFLQLIQEKTYTAIGALKSKKVDMRIISATNLDLKAQIAENKFREDLYYRLRVIELHMPPLRERRDAIEPLIDYFINQLNIKYNMDKLISEEAKEKLKQHHWIGNIRELQYVLERLFVTSPDKQITTSDLTPIFNIPSMMPAEDLKNGVVFDDEVEQFERSLLQKAFAEYKSSYKVANVLGMTQTRASRLLRKYDIK